MANGTTRSIRVSTLRCKCYFFTLPKGRDDSNEEKGKNRSPVRAVCGVGLHGEQTNQRHSNCDCRNQHPSAPMLVLNHCRNILKSQYTSRALGEGAKHSLWMACNCNNGDHGR